VLQIRQKYRSVPGQSEKSSKTEGSPPGWKEPARSQKPPPLAGIEVTSNVIEK
jgi:hypothetical protein